MYTDAPLTWPLPNVWIGVSVEDQATADERIPLLRHTPAAVRWVSAEPLLGPVDIGRIRRDGAGQDGNIDWIVAGGESGPHARPMHPDWARSLRDQCSAAGVPFLFKQWGEWGPDWDGARTCSNCGNTKADFASTGPSGDDECGHCGGEIWIDAKKPLDELRRVGKRRAGRLLDGVLHDGYPEARS